MPTKPVNRATFEERNGRTRRGFLAAMAALAASGNRISLAQRALSDDPEIRAVSEQLRAAGIEPIHVQPGTGYVFIGDAPAALLERALSLCKALQHDFEEHFRGLKFKIEPPSRRLTVLFLSGPQAYAKFLGVPQEETVGGHYDLDTNRLVLFDNRGRDDAGPLVERANTLALMHEASHQLCFNTGLLSRQADVPKAISEGLAMYCETRRPDGRARVGQINVERIEVLKTARQAFSVTDLITRDDLFDTADTQQVAYADAYLLVHCLLKSTARLPQFRSYLTSLRARRDSARRLDDLRATFGDPKALETEVRRHQVRLLK